MCLFIFGESLKEEITDAGKSDCYICDRNTEFKQVTVKNYFTFFFVRLLPLNTVSSYLECVVCNTSYTKDSLAEPACFSLLIKVMAYWMAGYGIGDQRERASDIFEKLTGKPLDEDRLKKDMRHVEEGLDFQAEANKQSVGINVKGRIDVLQLACLITWICCNRGYEDRLRLNLLATAMGLAIQTVEMADDMIAQKSYFGQTRLRELIH